MDQITLKAMAKVNLSLDVLRKRPDGYHELKMIMQSVNLYDKISIRLSQEPGIRLQTNLGFLPVNEDNLIWKAAKLLTEEYGLDRGVDISLQKFIPVAAGMAGGSTDAATTLLAMNKLFSLDMSKKQLMDAAVRLGADVPYCLMGGTVLSEGIGEILTPLPNVPWGYILIAKPPVSVSTKFVYTNLKLDEVKKHPDVDAQIVAIKKRSFEDVAKTLGNVLETVTIPAYPVIQEIKEFMTTHGALGALMSGSGPTVFGLYGDKNEAQNACDALRKTGLCKMVFLTTFIGRNPNAPA